MRRCSLGLVVALTACGSFKDTFTARRDAAAEAGALKLTPQDLAKIIGSPRGMRLNKDAAAFVTNLWVDYALFAQAAVNGKLPTDSASAAQALWPELAERRTQHWHDSIAARRGQPAAAAVDSVYGGDQVRVFQHILFGAQANAKPDVKAAARKKAEATLARLKSGADFGQLAAQLSDDPGTKKDEGFLPPGPRGRFVPAFDSAGWQLAPGATSGVVESPFGYHLIKRPAQTAVHDRLVAYLSQQGATHADSAYMEDLGKANDLRVAKNAPADMRAALANPDASRKSSKQVASFKGGALTIAEYLKWVRALPPQYTAQLRMANDTALGGFARVLALNLLLLRQADSAKVQLTPQEWEQVYRRYGATLDTLKQEMGLAGADSAEAAKDVGGRVSAYFEKLVSGQLRLRTMPSALSSLLRERARYRINDPGIARALELALAEQAKRDSSGQALKPAPGPAPVPGPPAGGDSGSHGTARPADKQ